MCDTSQPLRNGKLFDVTIYLRMHLLRSNAIGTEIIDNQDHQVHGLVYDLLVDADRGKIVALLVKRLGARELHALQVEDIVSWGNRVHVREPNVMAEASDFIRLEQFLEDPRTIFTQPIITEQGERMGRCLNFQFRTDTFDIEWIFPRKFFFIKGPALPVSEILEVTPEAIIVKDQGPRGEEETVGEVIRQPGLGTVVTPAARTRGVDEK